MYKVDVLIPDDLWEKYVKPDGKDTGGGLVCGECIMRILEGRGEYDAFRLVKI
jgi:hypothetical protein